MKSTRISMAAITLAALVLGAAAAFAQNNQLYERVVVQRAGLAGARTMKPLVAGTRYAVSSMMPQATLAAQHILESGGNAFDAIVGGQAVLGLVQPSANGLGSDAVLLVYDAAQKKTWSINAEGTAPRMATIDWFKQHSGGSIPVDHGMLQIGRAHV